MAKRKTKRNRSETPLRPYRDPTRLIREALDPAAPTARPIREIWAEILSSDDLEEIRPLIPRHTPLIHDTSSRPAFRGEIAGEEARDALEAIHDAFVVGADRLIQHLGSAECLYWLRRLRGQFDGVNNDPSTGPYVQMVAEALVTRTARPSTPVDEEEGVGHSYFLDAEKLLALEMIHVLAAEVYELHSAMKRCAKGQVIRLTPNQLPTWVPDATLDVAIRNHDRRTNHDEAGAYAALGVVDNSEVFGSIRLPIGGNVPLWRELRLPSLRAFSTVDPPPYLVGSIDLDPIQALHPGQVLDEVQVALVALLTACYLAPGEAVPQARQRLTSMFQWGYALLNTEGTLAWNLERTVNEMRDNPGAALAVSPTVTSAAAVLDLLATLQTEVYSPMCGNPVHQVGPRSLVDLVGASRRLTTTLSRPRTGNVRTWTDQFESDVQAVIDRTRWRPDGEIRDLVGKKIRRSDGTELTDIDAVAFRGNRLLLVSCKSYPLTREEIRGDFRIVPSQIDRSSSALSKWSSVVDTVREQPDLLRVPLPSGTKIDGCVVTPFVPFFTVAAGNRRVFSKVPVLGSVTELVRALAAA